MFRVIYLWNGERHQTTGNYATMDEALAVAREFRLSGFWARAELNL